MNTPLTLAINVPWDGLSFDAHREHLARLLGAGYSEVWTGESNGFDAITPVAVAAGWFPGIGIGVGIANVFLRGPALLAMAAATLCEAGASRVRLGLGPGTSPFAESWNGTPFSRPGERVAETLRFLRQVLSTGRAEGAFPVLGTKGFQLARVPAHPPALLVGALGPRLQRLAAADADGLLLSMVSPADVARTREDIARVQRSAGGDLELLAAPLLVAGDEPAAAVEAARRVLAAYLAVPGYARAQERFGRGAALATAWEQWAKGDRKAAVASIPDAVVDELVVSGTPAECAARLGEFAVAGAGTAVVTVLPVPGQDAERRTAFLAEVARKVTA